MTAAVESGKTFKEFAADFDRTINEKGPIKAQISVRGALTGGEVTYLPDNKTIIEGMPAISGLPPVFLVSPDGTFLDKEEVTPAVDEMAKYLQVYRTFDPRLIAETITGEEQQSFGNSCVEFDLERFPDWPEGLMDMIRDSRLKKGEAYYRVHNNRLYDLTLSAEELTLSFVYPERGSPKW